MSDTPGEEQVSPETPVISDPNNALLKVNSLLSVSDKSFTGLHEITPDINGSTRSVRTQPSTIPNRARTRGSRKHELLKRKRLRLQKSRNLAASSNTLEAGDTQPRGSRQGGGAQTLRTWFSNAKATFFTSGKPTSFPARPGR